MSADSTTATIAKNKSTDRNRAFWEHVERVAEQSRNNRGEVASHRDHREDRSLSRGERVSQRAAEHTNGLIERS